MSSGHSGPQLPVGLQYLAADKDSTLGRYAASTAEQRRVSLAKTRHEHLIAVASSPDHLAYLQWPGPGVWTPCSSSAAAAGTKVTCVGEISKLNQITLLCIRPATLRGGGIDRPWLLMC
jgi:hypothetical protein